MWNGGRSGTIDKIDPQHALRIGTCDHCGNSTVWVVDTMVYPDLSLAPSPNEDMPENVKNLYLEASSISSKSPRGSAALLR